MNTAEIPIPALGIHTVIIEGEAATRMENGATLIEVPEGYYVRPLAMEVVGERLVVRVEVYRA